VWYVHVVCGCEFADFRGCLSFVPTNFDRLLGKFCKFRSAAANSQTFAAKRGRRRRPTKELGTLQFSHGHVVLAPFSPVRSSLSDES
jgi:hypothetical protein